MDKAERDGNYAKAWQAQDIEQDQVRCPPFFLEPRHPIETVDILLYRHIDFYYLSVSMEQERQRILGLPIDASNGARDDLDGIQADDSSNKHMSNFVNMLAMATMTTQI